MNGEKERRRFQVVHSIEIRLALTCRNLPIVLLAEHAVPTKTQGSRGLWEGEGEKDRD